MKINCLDHGFVELLDYMGNDYTILRAAGECYQSKPKPDLIVKIIKNEHTSVLEHVCLQFKVKCPIFIARQWMRHRIGCSYNEKSLRYCEAKPEFYIPKMSSNKQLSWKYVYDYIFKFYKENLKMLPKEKARSILPLGLYTEFIFTCNGASLYHFLKLRLSPHAQEEMQIYARALLELAKEVIPITITQIENILSRGENINEKI